MTPLVRFNLQLEEKADWIKVFDSRDCTIFVTTNSPPEIGGEARVDLTVGNSGPKVILRGRVISRRMQGDATLPKGCAIALGPDEREKINYLNGFVRGGLLDLRERRRLPIRLDVTYGGLDGTPVESHSRDVNEEGVFILARDPLPEESSISLHISFPNLSQPFALSGTVSHTVVVEDEDVPGMGVRFEFKGVEAARFRKAVDDLEAAFVAGRLPEKYLL